MRLGGAVWVGAVGGCCRPAAARCLSLSVTSGAVLCVAAAPCPRWPCLVLWGAPCSSHPLMLVLGWLPVRGLGCTLLRHAALPAPPCPLLSSTDSNVSRALHPALVVINDGTTRAPGPHCCSIFNLHGTVSLCCFQSQHACGPGPASVTQASKQKKSIVVRPSLLEHPAVRGPGAPPAPLWGHPRATSAWETDERAAPAAGRARQLAYPLLDLSEAAGGAPGQRAARGSS